MRNGLHKGRLDLSNLGFLHTRAVIHGNFAAKNEPRNNLAQDMLDTWLCKQPS